MDQQYMKRALALAKQGRGHTGSNPMVGAVLVKDGKIIGEGYHEAYGCHHAEINALLSAQQAVEGATMYVTLEPCSHHGKTPPCAQAIIDHHLKEVVIATVDPNPLVSGKGIRLLKEAGIEVKTGVLEKESQALNEIFFTYMNTHQPFVMIEDRKADKRTHLHPTQASAILLHQSQLNNIDAKRFASHQKVFVLIDQLNATRDLPPDITYLVPHTTHPHALTELKALRVHHVDHRPDVEALLKILGDQGIDSLWVSEDPILSPLFKPYAHAALQPLQGSGQLERRMPCLPDSSKNLAV